MTELLTVSELLTVDEAAALLRTTRAGVYHLVERGQLPEAFRLGRRVLVRGEALRRRLGLLQDAPSNRSAASR